MVYPGDDDLVRTAISGAEFTAALNAIKSRRLTVVLDCCHAGGIGEPSDLGPAAEVTVVLSEGYLNELKTGTRRVIIAATRGSDPAYVRQGAKYALYRGGRSPAPHPVEGPDDGFEYDVFPSYRQREPNMTRVRRTLYPRLKAEGLKVFLDVVDFRLRESVIKEMERAVVRSRYTMAVLKPAYMASNFADFENVIAQHLGLEQSHRRFLGLLREPCTPRLGVRAP